jgi:transcriptional regulator with XRE-family HTH domain
MASVRGMNVKDDASRAAARKEGKAVAGIRALRSQLAEENPSFVEAVALEDDAERFCREVRGSLRDQRKAQGLDQSAVAKRLDMTQSAVSKIESGEGDIGMKTIFRYAHALGLLPVCVFLPDSSQMFAKQTGAAAKAARDLQTELVKDTSNAMSSAIAGFARAFSEKDA